MTVHYEDDAVTVHHGDCLDVLRTLPDASVDAIVTDPPYDLTAGKKGGTGPASVNLNSPAGRARITVGFMGKAWDGTGIAFKPELWAEALRILKPGGHLLAFGGSRTWHRLACAIEDAGFEVRDSIAWLYGSGFPKSLDVSKAIDKAAGVSFSARPASGVGFMGPDGPNGYNVTKNQLTREGESTPEAQQWQGWGTALKPAFEPIVVARKPLVGTVAANVLAWGTGALNVDGCRVAHRDAADLAESMGKNRHADYGTEPGGNEVYGDFSMVPSRNYDGTAGRWPTNVVLDGDAAAELDRQSGWQRDGVAVRRNRPHGTDANPHGIYSTHLRGPEDDLTYGGSGGASRFFPVFRYEAKAPAAERPRHGEVAHPTVKPLDLMRWLVRLVTPPGGTVLEPFAGSGTTAEACVIEGFRCIAIEREAAYLPLIVARLSKPIQPDLFGGAA